MTGEKNTTETVVYESGAVKVTISDGGGLGINLGGMLIVKKPEDWFLLAMPTLEDVVAKVEADYLPVTVEMVDAWMRESLERVGTFKTIDVAGPPCRPSTAEFDASGSHNVEGQIVEFKAVSEAIT